MDEKKTATMNPVVARAIAKFGQETVNTLKAKFAPRAVNVIEVEDKMAILRPINAKELGKYGQLSATDSPDVAARYLLDALWLEGDEELRSDEDYFIGAMSVLMDTIELKKSQVAKL